MAVREHGFKAEVQQLLNLMIHSVYSDREVFLRELISNAADALDKVRFMELTRKDLAAPQDPERLAVRIMLDAEAKTLTMEDDGLGMTEEEVIANLGTIARSGTRAFMEQLEDGQDGPQLIGQFGLGFYSAFMVAEEVTVDTLSAEPGAAPVKWVSQGEGTYALDASEKQHRGTTIVLKLRDDASEFLEAVRVRHAVSHHSNFLPWPIDVDGEQANSGKALWLERPSAVQDDEAEAFYRSVAMDWQAPALRVHVQVDSPLQYSALLFIPSQRPFDLFHPDMKKGPRLYVRRVLIDEHADGLIPDWLRFVRGVVDSEDIQLNVSREMVQKTPVVRKIRDLITKRVLKDLLKFASKEPEEAKEGEPPAHTYETLWRNFGALLKEGYYHDREAWGDALLPLLRFNSTRHEDGEGLCSLAAYKEALPEGQDTIWYLTGESREAALSSPHLEAFRQRGWEVLLLTEAVDEWLVQSLDTYEDLPLRSVSRGELELEESEEESEAQDLAEFTPWMSTVLEGLVAGVRTSSRLTDSAVVLVDDKDGMSANMERILRSANQDVHGANQRVLELNAKHPLIQSLVALHREGQTDAAKPLVRLLLDDALLLEGTVREPAAMGRRLQGLLALAAENAMARVNESSTSS